MATISQAQECPNEHSALIEEDDDSSSTTTYSTIDSAPTPLPKLQLFIVIFIQISEPVTSTVIYPFVNELIRSLGVTNGDEKRTGYYVGIVESVFYATEALTVLHWGYASDAFGRRPILLGGVLGLAISMLSFGLSKQYWMLILNRCMQGAFNGNIGVMKSVMGEITDSTNAAQAFSFLPIAWSIGTTVGPLIGGAFANPAKEWPEIFGHIKFFHYYPYFLPCFVAALVPLSAFLFAFLGLKETLLPKATSYDVSSIEHCRSPRIQDVPDYGTITNPAQNQRPPSLPPSSRPSFRHVLIPRVLIPVSNFAFLAFLDQAFLVLLPLIYSTPLYLGGLALSPSTIGSILGGWGVINGFVQVLGFPRLRRRVGHRNLYMAGMVGLGIALGMFPVVNWLARIGGAEDNGAGVGGLGVLCWLGIGVQLGLYMLSYMSYACMFMYISSSAPSRFHLGTTNGLAQLTASGVRAFAPTVASSLFALSLELHHTLGGLAGWSGGYLVYFVFSVILPSLAVFWSFRLPIDA